MDLSISAYGLSLSGDLKVLMTDYDTYAVTWTCVSMPIFGPVEIIWIASRLARVDVNVILSLT